MNIVIRSVMIGLGTAALQSIGASSAQIAPYIGPRMSPPPAKATGSGGVRLDAAQFGLTPNVPPSADPRDFNGMYFPQNGIRGTAVKNYNIDAAGLLTCRPEIQIGAGPYPEQIFQTPDRITFIEEYNHMIRRVYLNSRFPKKIAPSSTGMSIGHWDGNTLVIETRGLKDTVALNDYTQLASVNHIVERLSKIDDGKILEDVAQVDGVDHSGKPAHVKIDESVSWIGTGHVFEAICEEDAGMFYVNSGSKPQ